MDDTEITQLETVVEEFFNSASGRRKEVSVTFEPENIDRKGMLYVNGDVGFEDELLYLWEEHNFTIYTITGVRPQKFEDTKIGIKIKAPDPIPKTLTA
jgi:hypothetical protein